MLYYSIYFLDVKLGRKKFNICTNHPSSVAETMYYKKQKRGFNSSTSSVKSKVNINILTKYIDASMVEQQIVRSVHRVVASAWRHNVYRSSSTATAHSCDSMKQVCQDTVGMDRNVDQMGVLVEKQEASVSPWWQGTRQLSHRAVSLVAERIVESSIWLMAAPKRKTTPSRKGMRSSSKYIRFVPVVSQCSKCSRVFPPHSMPSKCEEDDCPAFPNRRQKDEL